MGCRPRYDGHGKRRPANPSGGETGSPRQALSAPHAGGGWGTQPERLLTLVRRLCQPLQFLHGEGLVHRDLKPDNILVQADETPVIIDFGLISRFAGVLSRETAEVSGLATGTVGYMAPEQAEGLPVDARADLYSLGCILFELVTGRRPFEGPDLMGILARTLTSDPEPPSAFVPGVPPPLEELIMGLLAREPRRRLGYADDVARRLAEIGAANGRFENAPRPRVHLYRPGLAGRAREIDRLEKLLKQIRKGPPCFLLLEGMSGVGKSRLISEIGRSAASRRVQVLIGGCLPERRGGLGGFGPILRALADRCRERGEKESDRIFGPRSKVLARYEPSLSGLPGAQKYQEPAALEAPAARRRVIGYVAESLLALTEKASLLLVVEDAQWAGDLTLATIEHLCHLAAQRSARVLVIVTCRKEEPREELESLKQDGTLAALSLDPMEAAEVGAMAADMLALPSLSPTFARFLAKQSEGNPFYVAEYLRTAVQMGLLDRTLDGTWQLGEAEGMDSEEALAALPVPTGVEALVLRSRGRAAGSRPGAARNTLRLRTRGERRATGTARRRRRGRTVGWASGAGSASADPRGRWCRLRARQGPRSRLSRPRSGETPSPAPAGSPRGRGASERGSTGSGRSPRPALVRGGRGRQGEVRLPGRSSGDGRALRSRRGRSALPKLPSVGRPADPRECPCPKRARGASALRPGSHERSGGAAPPGPPGGARA